MHADRKDKMEGVFMRHGKTILSVIILLFLVVILFSCLFPEKFEAKIKVNKDETYSLCYDGILTFVLAKAAEIEQGKLTAKDEKDIKNLEQEFKKDPDVKKVNYISHGQFKVLYERKGTLNSPIYFLNNEIKIFSIIPRKDKKVEINGMKLSRKDMEQLQKLKMKVDGRLEVSTNAKVIKHNASSEPQFFGLLGAYKWQIKSVSDPAPEMLIQLQ